MRDAAGRPLPERGRSLERGIRRRSGQSLARGIDNAHKTSTRKEGRWKPGPSPTNHYLAKVIVNVIVSGVAALAEIVTPNVNTLVVPAPTDAAEGGVNARSFDDEVTVGVTVSASWPEFATVI